MPIFVRDLIAEPSLHLRALTSHCSIVEEPITWVSTTELPDPLPFLQGGEVVMTTGMLERSPAEWDRLVSAFVDRPVAAVCFGVGLVHTRVPDEVVTAAESFGLALLSSPVNVPFVQISRWIADQIFGQQYDAIRTSVRVHDELVRELLSHSGLSGMLRVLYRLLSAGCVAIVSNDNIVIESYPTRVGWDPATAADRAPVTIDGRRIATLTVELKTARVDSLNFAATILGLEFARQRAVLAGSRQLLSQVVEDILHRTLSDEDARRRLAIHGVDGSAGHRVIVVVADRVTGGRKTDSAIDQLQAEPWALGPELTGDASSLPIAAVGGRLIVIAREGINADDVAERLVKSLSMFEAHACVGISAARPGIMGLRLGYAEALQAGRGGAGVHHAAPLSLTGLLLGNLDLPFRELGLSAVGPLVEHDADRDSHLVETLRSFLEHDCRPGPTAQALVLHRNSLRHRLQLIEELTDRDLGSLVDRMELWLALTAIDASRASHGGADD